MKGDEMKYKSVYFRINSSYEWGKGFSNEELALFIEEVRELFLYNGWELKYETSSNASDTFTKGKQELYCHPQSFSGAVIEEQIPVIEKMLKDFNGVSFRYKSTDIYETLFDYTPEQCLEILESKRNEIESELLGAYKTKRKNLFRQISFFDFAHKFKIKTIDNHIGASSMDVNQGFVNEIFQTLLKTGKIQSAQTRNGVAYKTVDL
jgi:hypothetical protein